ncbi:MAG TPA: MATE family efflux transporter [Candidatus Acidoferrum sp.]|nr:MATE family efflux transporter [Candidatus Acidoferrum sp.]
MRLDRLKGDRGFYRMVAMLVLPMIVQQGITFFVNLLDNIMIGALGTLPMSAVSIVNQLFFVVNLTLFGGLSGVSIFGAQFWGVKDYDGMRRTLRIKLMFGVAVTAATTLLLLTKGDALIGLWLAGDVNTPAEIAEVLHEGMAYLRIIILGLPAFMLTQVYVNTLRETGETVAPMKASLIAVLVNLVGNYLLIFGKFGFPALGAAGGAIATVAARALEALYIVRHAHRNTQKYPFIPGLYRRLHVPADLLKKVAVTGIPLLLNEALWSVGNTLINNSYSARGLPVVASVNILGTAWQFFAVVMFSMGAAVSILVGQKLGAGDIEGAKEINLKLLFAAFVLHIGVGLLLIGAAPFIPLLYKTEPAVRTLATHLLVVAGLSLPVHTLIHCAYFAIRSGGKTVVTFLFDCGFMWAVSVPLAFFLCRFTGLPVIAVYAVIQFADVAKLGIGLAMLKNGFWANNIIGA